MASAIPSDSYTFTVGKLDAGMAILLGERAHLIEFPSILLPAGATAGSIVSIAVHQNHEEEKRREQEFWDLQSKILADFGKLTPNPPKLLVRNITQTSVTLEWPQVQLATAKLRSLDMYRDNQRLAAIPSPLTNTSTKLSGLKVEQEYTFQLILRTTAGTFPSNIIHVRTHSMQDTSGISVCFGTVPDAGLLDNSKMALEEMNAKWSDKIQIDTTHFVCMTPSATPESVGPLATAPGVEYQRAMQLSIPIVQPQWILACHNAKTMIPIAQFYLGATPPTPGGTHHSSSSTGVSPTSPSSTLQTVHQPKPTTPTFNQFPPAADSDSRTGSGEFINSQQPDGNVVEDDHQEQQQQQQQQQQPQLDAGDPSTPTSTKRRSGTMNKQFKFPSPPSESAPPPPPLPSEQQQQQQRGTPAQEIPPPPPIEKNDSSGVVNHGVGAGNNGGGGGSGSGTGDEGDQVSEEGMDEIEL